MPNPNPKIILTGEQWKLIDNAAEIFCTGEEIALLLDIDYNTLEFRIKEKFNIPAVEYLKQKRSKGKMSLRRKQYEKAMSGDNTMLIWLGKQYLHQSDKQELYGKDGNSLQVNWILPEGTNAKP